MTPGRAHKLPLGHMAASSLRILPSPSPHPDAQQTHTHTGVNKTAHWILKTTLAAALTDHATVPPRAK